MAVTVTYATGRGHALIGRALYLPEACAADEEHRELAGIPEEVVFASKPQLAGALLDRAPSLGIRAAFVAGDEVYGGRQLRVFGIFPTCRWPAQDASHNAQVRRLVTQALVQQTALPARTAALIALLHALRYEHKIVDPGECGLSRQQLRARAEEIAKGHWAPEAARQAIGAMIAAVVAAASAAAAAGSVSSALT